MKGQRKEVDRRKGRKTILNTGYTQVRQFSPPAETVRDFMFPAETAELGKQLPEEKVCVI